MITTKGEATRDRIVDAAAALIYQRGVTGTSTSDIQAAAGVSASQIYHYFGDKSALTRAVIEYQTNVILGFQEPLLKSIDGLEGLRRWAAIILDIQRLRDFRGGCPLGSLASELADNDSAARENIAASYRRWQGAIRAGLAAMRDRGELAESADIDTMATVLLTALQGGLLLGQVLRDGQPLEVTLNAVIDYIAAFTTAEAGGNDSTAAS